jgi:DNA-binding CsgD family transcriptional regulator/PAS domain-containing protein
VGGILAFRKFTASDKVSRSIVSETHTRPASDPTAGRLIPAASKGARRTRVKNPGLFSIPSHLQPALMKLNAAQETRGFWESTKGLLHQALPLEFCCINFRPLLTLPAMTFRERAPFASEEEFERFCRLSPFSWWARDHPGVKLLRLTDVIGTAQLLNSEYFHQFMAPSNSRYEACLTYWDGGAFEGIVGLHRAANHGDFTDSEMRLLEQLYPYFQNAVRRLLRAHREKARRISLEVLVDHLPVPTIILDWELRVSYRNRAAEEIGILWNLGPEAARNLKPHQSFAVPAKIVEACQRLKESRAHGAESVSVHHPHSVVIQHDKVCGLRASILPLQMEGAALLSPPMFLVRLESRDGFPGERRADADKLALWANLSPSEQHVAWLASQGHRNAEIAGQLNKSVLTVKKQLQCVYQKLEVHGRARLIALFG